MKELLEVFHGSVLFGNMFLVTESRYLCSSSLSRLVSLKNISDTMVAEVKSLRGIAVFQL